MAKHCQYVCGVDVSRDCVASASRRHPALNFHVLDVMNNPQVSLALYFFRQPHDCDNVQQLPLLLQPHACTKAFVDLGGNR